MPAWFFATDIHGRTDRYETLFESVIRERPNVVLLGGDLLPGGLVPAGSGTSGADFITDFLASRLRDVRARLGGDYPDVVLILGNDDPASEEPSILSGEELGLWHYAHKRRIRLGGFDVYGYACVPPTPFGLKDWERYDVSRYVDPGCLSPEEGWRSVPVDASELRYGTIEKDLEELAGDADFPRAIFLFHTPPYDTPLDRAALDGRRVDHVPLDVHVGSIAVRRFIEVRQPLMTLHGHIHEAARLSGAWKTTIGSTICLGGAHDGDELALVSFDPGRPESAGRRIIRVPSGGS